MNNKLLPLHWNDLEVTLFRIKMLIEGLIR